MRCEKMPFFRIVQVVVFLYLWIYLACDFLPEIRLHAIISHCRINFICLTSTKVLSDGKLFEYKSLIFESEFLISFFLFYIAVNCIVFDVARWGQNAVYNAVAEDIVAQIVVLQRLAACCIIICCANLCTVGCVDIFYLFSVGKCDFTRQVSRLYEIFEIPLLRSLVILPLAS